MKILSGQIKMFSSSGINRSIPMLKLFSTFKQTGVRNVSNFSSLRNANMNIAGRLGIRQSAYTRANSIARPSKTSNSSTKSLGFLTGVTVATSTLYLVSSPILAQVPATFQQDTVNLPISTTSKAPVVHHSRFNKKLDYNELTLGSITGLFLGVIVGKLSSVLVILSMSSYLFVQFLENRGIITIPWRSFINLGGRKIDLHDLFFEQPSFKVSFVLTFLIAAYNI